MRCNSCSGTPSVALVVPLGDAADDAARKATARRIFFGLALGLGAALVIGVVAAKAINRSIDRDAWG